MTDDISKSNYLTDLAARIRIQHEAVRHSLRSAVEHAMGTGDLLLEAKETLQHGQWTQWIQEHCEISDRSARLYMRLAKNRGIIEAARDVAGLTLNSAVRLLAVPKDDAETEDDFLAEAADKINIAYAQFTNNVLQLRKCLMEARAELGDEQFKVMLQENFPESTDPGEIEFANQLHELIMDVLREAGFPRQNG